MMNDEKKNIKSEHSTSPDGSIGESTEIPVTIENASEKRSEKPDNFPEGPEVSLESYMRLQAEFSNYRKRTQKEQERSHSFARGELIKSLLPVIDDFERMITHHGDEKDISLDGIVLIYQKMRKILADQGLEEISALHELFDPEVHEAMIAEEADEDLEDRVTEVWLKGYRLNERILRPAKVKVGRRRAVDDSL